MKEKYVKPTIYMESFALTQTIARSCNLSAQSTFGRANHYSPDTCEWMMGDIALFLDNCSMIDMSEYEEGFEGICLNNPNGGQQVFSSI